MVTPTAQAYDPRAVRLPHFSPTTVRKVALASVIAYALLVVSGGAVRLTGSGLGCPDWPSCYQHHLTAVASFHPVVEFLNRLVSGAVTVLSFVAFAAAAGPHLVGCGAGRRHPRSDRARGPGCSLQAEPLPRRLAFRSDDRDPR